MNKEDREIMKAWQRYYGGVKWWQRIWFKFFPPMFWIEKTER